MSETEEPKKEDTPAESKIETGPFGIVSLEEVAGEGGIEKLNDEAHKAVETTIQEMDALIDAKIMSPTSEEQVPFLQEAAQKAEVVKQELGAKIEEEGLSNLKGYIEKKATGPSQITPSSEPVVLEPIQTPTEALPVSEMSKEAVKPKVFGTSELSVNAKGEDVYRKKEGAPATSETTPPSEPVTQAEVDALKVKRDEMVTRYLIGKITKEAFFEDSEALDKEIEAKEQQLKKDVKPKVFGTSQLSVTAEGEDLLSKKKEEDVQKVTSPVEQVVPVENKTERKVVELEPEDYDVLVEALINQMAKNAEANPMQRNEDMVLLKKMQEFHSDRGELTADAKEALQKEIGQKMNERVDGVLWRVIDEINKKRPDEEKLTYDKTRDDFTGITKKAFLDAHTARKAALHDDIMVLKTYAENRAKDDPTFDDSEEGQRLMKHLERLLADELAYESINLDDLSVAPSDAYKKPGEVTPAAEEVFDAKFAPVATTENNPVPPTPLNEAGNMPALDFLKNIGAADTSKAALYQNFPTAKKEEGAKEEVVQSVPTGNTVQPAAHQTIGGTFRPGAPLPMETPVASSEISAPLEPMATPTEPLPGTGTTELDPATQERLDAVQNKTNAMRFKEQQAAEAADKDAVLEMEDRISWKVDQQLKASTDMASMRSTENMTNAQKFAYEKEQAANEAQRTAEWQRQQAFNRTIEDIRNQAKVEVDPEKRRELWGQIDNEIRSWEAAKQPRETAEVLAAMPAEEPVKKSAQIRQEAIMNPNLTKEQFDAAMALANEEEAKENAAAAVAATTAAAVAIPAMSTEGTATAGAAAGVEPVEAHTETTETNPIVPPAEIPAPQPNMFEDEENELRNQENRERYETILAQPRKDVVDADISLREWFTGKDKFSPYTGTWNTVKNKWRAWTKSDKESPDMVKVTGLVDAAMHKLIAQEADATIAVANRKSLDTILSELKETKEFSGIQALDPQWDKTLGATMTRIKMAVEAKKKYTLARKEVLDAMMESKVGALDINSPAFKEKSKEVNKEVFASLVLGEYDAQTKLREEKLNGGPEKAAGILRRGWEKYKNLKWYTKMGIGVLVVPTAVGVGTYAAGAGLAAAGIGTAGMIATRAMRAGLGMVGARLGSYVGDALYRKGPFWGERKARKTAEKEGRAANAEALEANITEKEWSADMDSGKEALNFLVQSYDQYAKIQATEQKLQRRKNIAKVLGGIAGGVGTATLGYNLASSGVHAVEGKFLGELPDESTVRVNDPNMAELKNADGTQPGSRVEAGSSIEGYHVTKGQGIWHGVKQQMKDYITAGKVKPEDLGLKTQEQLDTLKLDLQDGKLDAANVRLLDRAIARSINANHMMNMGIKQVGETVTWKPNSTGGQIEFGTGDKALYQMGGKHVAVEQATQTSGASSASHEPILTPGDESKLTQGADQIAAAKEAIAARTGMGGSATTAGEVVTNTEAVVNQPKVQWYDQLSGTQRANGEALFGDFKQRYGVDLNNSADAVNQARVGDVYKLAKSWPDDGTSMPLKLTIAGVEQSTIITPELRRAILAVPPTEAEANTHFDNFMRAKVALKGSIDLAPKIESVVVQPTPEVKPAPTPIEEIATQPKTVGQSTPEVRPGPTPTMTPEQSFERPALIYKPPIGPQPTNVIKPINFDQINIDQPPVPPTIQ